MQSISGIRGTLQGRSGEALTPMDVLRFVTTYTLWLERQGKRGEVVMGRDARPSGVWIASLVAWGLRTRGFGVRDIGLSTTPTLSMATGQKKRGGGGGDDYSQS